MEEAPDDWELLAERRQAFQGLGQKTGERDEQGIGKKTRENKEGAANGPRTKSPKVGEFPTRNGQNGGDQAGNRRNNN
jgi:hypothetical protein